MQPFRSPGYDRFKAKLKEELADILETSSRHGLGQVRRDRHAVEAETRELAQSLLAEWRGGALQSDDQDRIIHEVLDEIVGLGPLDPLLADPEISEVMVNGPNRIYIERSGKIERVSAEFRDTQHLMAVIDRLLTDTGVTLTEAEPCVDASLPDGLRVNIIIPPLALNGPTLTIRKKLRPFTQEDWIALEAFNPAVAKFLEACVKARVNMVVSGGTSSGKTTLVSILSGFIPREERLITIENVAELELSEHEHWVRLVARPPNLEGRGEVSLRALVKNALRMRPDRIILGEARGGEALDVVQAMLTGHDGVITVLHASNCHAALERLETLMLMSGLDLSADVCRRQVASAVELVIQLSHFPDGTRRVENIVQVAGTKPDGFLLEELFNFRVRHVTEQGKIEGALEPTGVLPRFHRKFSTHNIHLPEELFTHA
jgi:pilus assembly protein CpaF